MEVKVKSRGRITLPASVRRALGITGRTRIVIEVDEEKHQIVLTPITPSYIHSLHGKYKGMGLLESLMEDRAREKDL